MGQIVQVMEQKELAKECLKLEITESAIIQNKENAQGILSQLQNQKIKISIDDFGTGYSSLSYLILNLTNKKEKSSKPSLTYPIF